MANELKSGVPSTILSTIGPVLRHRGMRVLLVATPGAAVAVVALTVATGLNPAAAIVVNLAIGVIVSSVLFLAVGFVARQLASEWVAQTHAASGGLRRSQLLSIYDDEAGLYADWYFRLRIKEEIARALRYGGHIAVLLVEAPQMAPDGQVNGAYDGRAEQMIAHLRRSDLPALLRDGSLGIIMPNTNRRSASMVRCRISVALPAPETGSGLACFPEDGEDASALLAAADREVQRLREGRNASDERRPIAA
jgi:hypothetical protein